MAQLTSRNAANPLDEFEPEVWAQSSIHAIIARAMARPDAQTFKFDADMVRGSKPLWDWAEYLVDHYVGTFELMVKFRTDQRLGRQLSENQLKVALNTMLNVWRQSLKRTALKLERQADPTAKARQYRDAFDGVAVDFTEMGKVAERRYPTSDELFVQEPTVTAKTYETKPEVVVTQVTRPHDGTYTYVDGAGEYRVIRFETPKESKTGATFVSFQYGSDNDSDFAKCGRIDKDGSLIIWQRGYLKADQKVALDSAQRANLVEAIVFICSLDKEGQLKSGEAYAMRSGNCFICGRTLTVPSSISAGIGPVCAKRWGV